MARWPEQLERIERWESRIDFLMKSADSIFDREAASYADDFHAFFVECYHMKDWLIKDAEIGEFDKSPKEIEQFIDDTPCLAFCADLCNLKKHLVLEKKVKGEPIATNRYKHARIEGLRFSFVVCNDDAVVEAGENRVGATRADEIRRRWYECGMDENDITIQVFRDPITDDWANMPFDGAIDLASQAVRAWRRFVGME